MIIIWIMVAGVAICRTLGWLGWLDTQGLAHWNNWQGAVRGGLALMFLASGLTHFTPLRQDLVKMVPGCFAEPMAMVYFTGFCELCGAVGLLIPGTMAAAGACLALLMIVLFPANLRAIRENIAVGNRPPAAFWIRGGIQLLLIGAAIWATRS